MFNINRSKNLSKYAAMKFIILIGIVSFFSDMTYEGARSITGPYLALLGANAVVVGFVAGFGEWIGYGLRLVSGYLADKTGKYWVITFTGYALNLLAVPLLALAGHWWIAATLMVIERIGKAIRVPARDAMLSHAGEVTGMGWGFGLHEALDRAGAMLGPLLVAIILYFKNSYQFSFAILIIPAILALCGLVVARWLYPSPHELNIYQKIGEIKNLQQKSFWLYLIGASLVAAGYADFPLMAYHFQKVAVVPTIWIPLSYSLAMGFTMVAAPVLGYWFDRKGLLVLVIVTVLTCFFAPLVFLGGEQLALLGVILWGIGMGAHESLMRAVIANMISTDKRGRAYGIFNMAYGSFWFLGSVLMGALYDISITWLVVFSLIIQLAAVPFLCIVMRRV